MPSRPRKINLIRKLISDHNEGYQEKTLKDGKYQVF
jgi:hypothetical protein